MKKQKEMRLGALWGFVLLSVLLVWLGYMRGDIGLSEEAMRRENAELQYENTDACHDVGESMAVFLQYKADPADFDTNYSAYVKRTHSIGWHFRFGAAGAGEQPYLLKQTLEENGEYLLLYLDMAHPVARIEIDKGDGNFETITHLSGRPFAFVMDRRWNVTVYDENGEIIRPIERKM